MEKFIIEGGHPISGTVIPSGNKNAALPLLAACLLTDEPVTLHNLPAIGDVTTMGELLANVGVSVEKLGSHTWRLQARDVRTSDLDPNLFGRIRGSITLTGPMLARTGTVHLPRPGGDVIGRRRMDTHFLALGALGADVDIDGTFSLHGKQLRGADILLDEASVTATENAITAATLAKGTTIIRNAACEPHVQDLCHMLCRMGAQIEGIGSNTLTIRGVDRLSGGEYTIGPDYMEVGSYIALAAMTGGELLIKNSAPEHMRMVSLAFKRMGVRFEARGQDIFVPADQSLTIVPDAGGAIPSIADAPWPGFPADLMSVAIVLASQSSGTILFHEKMFESRLYFVDKLIWMGARIILCDPHRCVVQGHSPLHGDEVESPDIRAGMALLSAALCAEGQSVIRNIRQIDRGYERIEEKLRRLGAKIERTCI
ncbi:MAG: UDP-N-acetylglucosamine 1-carboxyvinyltransferase [Chloroflexi bacterium]|nr:MAG: UDP-N-acetylglucosamine 1-carboxyvinyltransferase [Chloroflexota bacterium]RLC76241.1 MAG: UDP-N-acetylglucosamine 1-carboxyvinyltransferase [Chloroflexota bacterium]